MKPRVEILVFPLGPLQVNTCVIRCGRATAVVDPTIGVARVLRPLLEQAAPPEWILLTHGHADHIVGIEEVRALAPGVRVAIAAADAHMLIDPEANLSAFVGLDARPGEPDRRLAPGETVAVGQSEWTVLDTSGHTPGGVSFYCPDAATVIVGDSLFAGGIGRYDLPGSSFKRLRDNIRGNLFTLPEETRVIAGHGPETTVGAEKTGNPFLTLL